MLGLEVVVLLGAALLVCSVLAKRVAVPAPVILLVLGLLLGFAPTLRQAKLPSEAVLLIFLPALLFWECLTTSLREIRSNLRPIVLLSIGLVVATAAAVAATGHALGMPWGPAWVLGAAVAPTDATAVGVLARALSRRQMTVLRAEGLVNDGTALVIYGLAVGVTAGEDHLGVAHVTGLLVLSYGAGIAAGVITAVAVWWVRRYLTDPIQENLSVLIAPFTAFLLAELVHASGVLGVVTCGLIMSQTLPRSGRADARQQGTAFWTLSTFVLNGSLFVLIGIQAQSAARELTSIDLNRAVMITLAVSAVVVATRFAWLFTTTYLIRALDRRPQQRLRRANARTRIVNGVAGFRGAVSLAAALAVPTTVHSGGLFPERDLIVFVTAGVVVVMLAQSLVLPLVVRWADLPPDTSVAEEREFAASYAAEQALEAIPSLAAELGTSQRTIDRVRHEFQKHMAARTIDRGADGQGESVSVVAHYEDEYDALRLAALGRKRAAVLQLRDEQRIDDTVLRQMQARLDAEELRLTIRPEQVE